MPSDNTSGKSRANKVREVKRTEILLALKNKGLVQKVIEDNEKLADLTEELSSIDVQRIKAANDTRMQLIKKYLPDIKQTELVGEEGASIKTDNKYTVEFINASPENK